MSTEEVISFFCQQRGIPLSALEDPKRKCDVWVTRYMIWFYLHYNHGMSTAKLSRYFKRTRHSVFRGMRTFRNHMKCYAEIRIQYDSIVKKLEGMTEATPSENMEEK